MLARVDQETKSGKNGVYFFARSDIVYSSTTDVDTQLVPPRWQAHPQILQIDDAVYELVAALITSISMVTDRIVKVLLFGLRRALTLLTIDNHSMAG